MMKRFQLTHFFLHTSIHPSIKLSPKGQSLITEPSFWLHRAITAGLRLLVGDRISQGQGFGQTRPERLRYYSSQDINESRHPVSLVKSDQWENQLLRSGWRFFQLTSTLAALSVFWLGKAVFLLPFIAWGWLGYELAKIENWKSKLSPKPLLETYGEAIGKLMIVAAMGYGLSILFIVVFYPITFGLSVWMMPFLLAGLFGACAFMVRLLRVAALETLPTDNPQPAITCQSCNAPMRQLNATELRQHLTPAQHTEIVLNTKYYEAWQCQACLPPYHPQDLNIHLGSYILNPKRYEKCQSCQTLTVQVTHYTLQKATKRKKGQRTETRYCHHCKARSTEEKTIPTRTRTWTTHSSSSTNSGGYYSASDSSSYSSDSGSFSGGDFGGGDSGGGGAGDSW